MTAEGSHTLIDSESEEAGEAATPGGNTSKQSRLSEFLSSTALVKVIAFNSVFLGALVTSVVIPILPALLASFEEQSSLGGARTNLTSSEYEVRIAPPGVRSTKIVVKASYIFLAKPFSEMLTNLVTGKLVDSFGFRIPLIVGSMLSCVSVVGFCYVNTILLMTLMRIIEGIGTSLSVVSALAMVTSVFRTDDERTKAISIGYMGWSAGVAFGYPFGAVTYFFFGRNVPFLTLGVLSVLDGILRFVARPPVQKSEKSESKKINRQNVTDILRNKYVILILTLCLMMYTIAGVYLTVTPDWMLHDLHATMWQVGVVLLIGAVFQTCMKYYVGWYGIRVGRWICAVVGYLLLVIGLATYTLPPSIWALLGPDLAMRIGYAANACSLTSLLALVCERYFPDRQGTTFGIYNAVTNLGFVIGPLVNIALIELSLTTTWCLRVFALLSLVSSGTAVLLKYTEHSEDELESSLEESQKSNPSNLNST